MNDFMIKNLQPLKRNERICFECSGCGSCCRHIRDSVPLESLDAYRLAVYLREKEISITSMDEFLYRYAKPIPIHSCGYFLYTLKTVGSDDACIFLKNNRCTIHPAKPRACRTYPISAEPLQTVGFQYHLCTEKPYHFSGHSFKVRDFIKRYFSLEDQLFVTLDFQSAVPISNLLHKVPLERKKTALVHFLRYKYSDFDLDQPFLEQYKQNNKKLIEALKLLL